MADTSGKSIARRDLAAVVRRAAELAEIDDNTEDELTEQEVIRIAAELGLAERHVRQALYEAPQDESEFTLLDRHFAPPRFSAARAVPLAAAHAQRLLEDYFVTHEYLQIVRRRADTTTFERAGDTISKVVRALRGSSKHQLARAEHIELTVRSLEAGWSHVRIRAVYRDERKSQLTTVALGSVFLGITGGAAAGTILGGMFGSFAGTEGAMVAGVLIGIATFGAISGGLLASAKSSYRRWRERASTEAEIVLDRAEKGGELRPPPAPWIRKLQLKLGL